MAVRCSKCGEELLGPVNRCWKCGQTFATLPDAGGVPPVRRDTTLDKALPAATVTAVPATAKVEDPIPAVVAEIAELVATEANSAAGSIRTGSPFSAGAAIAAVAAKPATNAASPPGTVKTATQDLVRDQVAVAGAIGSLVLGGFGVAVAWMQNPPAVIGGLLVAVMGMAMGIWGLHSKCRGWALFGMLICVAAFSLASYSGAMILYQMHLDAKEMEGRIE